MRSILNTFAGRIMTQQQSAQQIAPNANLTALAQRLNINEQEAQQIVINTLMKAKKGQNATNEEFVTFLAIASEYKLNPLTKEIYAFSNRGAIQPIVSIDGWLKIINSHPQCDGMEFIDSLDDKGNLISVTCKIYRKDRTRHTEVTEYLSECQQENSDPWKRWPARMLRHKATIQCARYAFGLSGIVDPDEAERIESVTEKDITPAPQQEKQFWPEENFKTNLPRWKKAVDEGLKTVDDILAIAESKGSLTDEQKTQIQNLNVIEG